jgi:hypothetical protein
LNPKIIPKNTGKKVKKTRDFLEMEILEKATNLEWG